MKHKWHDEIVAWAGGTEIEVCKAGVWYETDYPDFHHTGLEFRIKPQPKEKKYLYVFHNLDECKYEIGALPHPQMNYKPIIGKIEVLDYD